MSQSSWIRGLGALTLCCLAMALASCSHEEDAPDASRDASPATSTAAASAAPASKVVAILELESRSGSTVKGAAEVYEYGDGKIGFVLELTGATPGEHAVHIHESGDCSADDASSAGGHWNPAAQPHGPSDSPHHLGDLGNCVVHENGEGTLELLDCEFNAELGDPHSVIGKSLIVHEREDDFTTQPSGNAGPRVACGAFFKSVKRQ